MATSNAQETLARANDFIARYNTGSIVISEGATVLATHTITGMSASNSGNNAVINSTTIADVAIGNTGTADTVVFSIGGTAYDLVIGVDIILTTTAYVTGEQSKINSLNITFNA